jgi:hypothetical protein
MEMPRFRARAAVLLLLLVGCSSTDPQQTADAGPVGFDADIAESGTPGLDGSGPMLDAAGDAGVDADPGNACTYGGAPGECITTAACAAMSDRSSFAGRCPGPASIQCCIKTPSTADNPPTPVGYKLMQQVDVTTDMTTWAVIILNDPATYPMFSTTTKTFGTLMVLARVEWHPPDFQNAVIHRGVTLYEPG